MQSSAKSSTKTEMSCIREFLFKAHQYLYGVIIERMKREPGYENLAKIDVWKNMERDYEPLVANVLAAFPTLPP
mgnify:CR=1 FL=1